ncbi:hypothetical protein AVEN_9843-1, partial [Araneus ventricosus]
MTQAPTILWEKGPILGNNNANIAILQQGKRAPIYLF